MTDAKNATGDGEFRVLRDDPIRIVRAGTAGSYSVTCTQGQVYVVAGTDDRVPTAPYPPATYEGNTVVINIGATQSLWIIFHAGGNGEENTAKGTFKKV